MVDEVKNKVDDQVEAKTTDVLWAGRAEHREREEKLQFLLNECVVLQEEKEELQSSNSALCLEKDKLLQDLNKITKERFTHKKVRGQLFITSANR